MKLAGKLALGAVAAPLLIVAGVVAVAWAPDRSVAELRARWAPAPSQFAAIDGLQVHLRDEGPTATTTPAPPIVLIHGTSASLHTWDGWTEALKPQRRVIRFDLPGFGLTGPDPTGDYSMDRYARFVAGVLDHLGVARAVVAGNSLGGSIAWHLAATYPKRVASLVLVDAGGYAIASQSVPIGFRMAQVPLLAPLMDVILPRGVVRASVENVYGDPTRVDEALVDRYYELTLRAGNRAALRDRFDEAPSGTYQDRIATVTQPTLIVWGGQDRLIPPDHAERFARDLTRSTVAMFEALGHVPHEEDPAATAAAVQAFLAPPSAAPAAPAAATDPDAAASATLDD